MAGPTSSVVVVEVDEVDVGAVVAPAAAVGGCTVVELVVNTEPRAA